MPTENRKFDPERDNIYVTRTSMPPFEEYMEMLKPLWDSHFLTNMGTYHKRLEKELGAYLEVPEVSLIVNGHTALELALQSFEFPEGGEVITTPFTFISTTHAIVRNRLTPVFCDIKDDFTLDEEKIEDLITEKTVAILPVHVYGNICNVARIEEIAYKFGLKVIYDAAHAFGETYQGRGVGQFGDLSVFSFHATKVFSTIEGGCVCCQDRKQYDALYNLRNFGIRSEELVVSVGSNAKMNEFQAAMGLCNLRHIDGWIEKRKEVMEAYHEYLDGRSGIWMNHYHSDVKPNYAYLPVLFDNREIRDGMYDMLREHHIFSRKYFYPITADAACFRNKYRGVFLERARDASERVLALPIYDELAKEDVRYICDLILDRWKKS